MTKEPRFDPMKEIQNFGEQISKQIEKGIRTVANVPEQIILDMYEADGKLMIHTSAIDGLVKTSIEISVENNILTIGVQTEPEAAPPATKYLLQERRFGHLSRAVELPFPVKASEARAKLGSGDSLIISLPIDDSIYGSIKVTPVE